MAQNGSIHGCRWRFESSGINSSLVLPFFGISDVADIPEADFAFCSVSDGKRMFRISSDPTSPGLEYIDGLQKTLGLEELSILYGKKLKDIEVIAELSHSRCVRIVGCGNIGIKKISGFLKSVKDVLISASCQK